MTTLKDYLEQAKSVEYIPPDNVSINDMDTSYMWEVIKMLNFHFVKFFVFKQLILNFENKNEPSSSATGRPPIRRRESRSREAPGLLLFSFGGWRKVVEGGWVASASAAALRAAGAGKAASPPSPKRAAGPAGLSVPRPEGRMLPEDMIEAESCWKSIYGPAYLATAAEASGAAEQIGRAHV